MNTIKSYAIAFLLSLTACSFDSGGLPVEPDAGADTDADTEPQPVPCTTHAECEAVGLDCDNDRCMEGYCRAYSQCMDGQSCLPGEGDEADACGTPPECHADTECDDGNACTDNFCVEGKCEAQSNCPSGQECLEGVCRPPGAECVYDADCTGGLACEDAYCYDYQCEYYDGCDSGQVCTTDGSCRTPPQCDEDTDCPDSDPSSCMVPDCAAAGTCAMVSNCPSGQTCTSSGCVTPGTAGVTLSATTVAATEGGSTGSYTVVLNTAPTHNVLVTVTPNFQASVSATTLTFTTANWNTAQTVTVTAVNDTNVEGAHAGTVTHAANSADSAYNGVSVPSVSVNITDNDSAPSNPTIECSPATVDGSPKLALQVTGPDIETAFYDSASVPATTACYLQIGWSEPSSSWPPYGLSDSHVSRQWVTGTGPYWFYLPPDADEIGGALVCGSSTYWIDVTPTNSDGDGTHFVVTNASGGHCQVLCGPGSCAISTDGEF